MDYETYFTNFEKELNFTLEPELLGSKVSQQILSWLPEFLYNENLPLPDDFFCTFKTESGETTEPDEILVVSWSVDPEIWTCSLCGYVEIEFPLENQTVSPYLGFFSNLRFGLMPPNVDIRFYKKFSGLPPNSEEKQTILSIINPMLEIRAMMIEIQKRHQL